MGTNTNAELYKSKNMETKALKWFYSSYKLALLNHAEFSPILMTYETL